MMTSLVSSLVIGCLLLDPWSTPPRLQVALRCACDELECRYRGNLSAQVSALLPCGDGGGDGSRSAQRQSLTVVREELFRDGVNWGRIVAMMELGGALSAEVAKTGGAWRVDDIARWMEESLDSPLLQGWIEDNGGWVGRQQVLFLSFFFWLTVSWVTNKLTSLQ
uniref:Bcl-2 Bcl-2 homology region 1-3 domain-containing protein n=1 Tax=Seriola lalandi dorsalis TaxID=1841481 RepID=A0A3B4YFW5_SERLL